MNQQETKQHKSNGKRKIFLSVLLGAYDFAAVCVAYFFALWMRFDFFYSHIEEKYLYAFKHFILFYAAFSVLILWAFRLYKTLWRYIGLRELVRTLSVSIMLSVIHAVAISLIFWHRMPVSYYLGGALIQAGLLIGIRLSARLINSWHTRRALSHTAVNRVMLIGAGNAGQLILRDMLSNPGTRDKVVCIIDDDPNKRGRYLDDVPIIGGRENILAAVEKYRIDKIYLSIPSATAEQKRDILAICSETNCELKQLPGMYQLITGQVTVSAMKDVAVEDLLGRDPIRPDLSGVYSFINGKTVLVTGGGGSIGSELCRQIAAHQPKRLIIFDVYENNAYDIQQELKDRYPELDLVVLIGSVRDSRRMFEVFDTDRPQIVYQAAAHKHVPLMEDSPAESIKNNVFGTYKLAKAAGDFGTELFILISTDKAVNPTNVMGASKRLCEMIVQSMNGRCGTNYIAVRFGNVLGSNGSVIPLFKKQIAEGGPVTVTDKRVTRFFMTIPEAVSLILQAGAYAKGGEVFVLDMGAPVRIDDMARKMIRLSGFEPDVDIKIVYTGLRPGEKLYEELLLKSEGLEKTDNSLIYIGHQVMYTPEQIEEKMDQLRSVLDAEPPEVRACMLSLIREPQDSMYAEIPIAREDEEPVLV